MKLSLLTLLAFMLLYACDLVQTKNKVQEFIPGTYIRFSQHEFGKEYDTMVISRQNKSANEYAIIRKSKYERVLDGKRVEPEYKRSITTGIYNSEAKILRETETGDYFSFDMKQKTLFIGPIKYQKL